MLRVTFFLLFLVLSINCSSQQWLNYTDEFFIPTLSESNGKIWVGTAGGVACFDKNTKTSIWYNRGNSKIGCNYSYKIEADSAGRIWTGSQSNCYPHVISMFDGSKWTAFYNNPTNGDTLYDTGDFAADKSGNVYFSMLSTIVKVDSNLNFSYLPPIPNDTLSTIANYQRVAIDTSGGIYFTNQTLKYWDGISWTQIDTSNSNIGSGFIKNVFVDKNNVVFVRLTTTANDSKWFFRDSSAIWQELIFPLSISSARHSTELFIDHNNFKWFYNSSAVVGFHGLVKYDGVNFFPYSYPGFGFPSPGNIPSLYVDSQDHIFAAFLSGGHYMFYEFDGNSWTSYELANSGAKSNYAEAIEIDHHGIKWIGYGSGSVSSFDGITWNTYDSLNSGLPGNGISTIVIDNNNYIWAGSIGTTYGPPLSKFDGVNWVNVLNFPGQNVNCGDTDMNGYVWLGSHSGVHRFDGNNWITFPLTVGDEIVLSITHDFQNRMWASTMYNGLFMINPSNGVVQNFTSSNSGISDNHCGTLALDSAGTIHVSVQGNVFVYDGIDFTPANPCANILSGQNNNYIIGAGPDCLWYSGYPALLIKYDSLGCIPYTFTNSNIANFPYDLAYDISGNIWLATTKGLQVFNPDSINHESIYYPASYPVTGKVFYDDNQNGDYDVSSDFGLADKKIFITPDSTFAFTNSTGKYIAYLDSGFYELSHPLDTSWQLTSDSTVYHLLVKDQPLLNNDFGLWTSSLTEMISIDITPGARRCNTESNHWIYIQNTGNIQLSGIIKYLPDDSLTLTNFFPPPDAFSNDTAIWNYTLVPNQSFSIVSTFINPGIQPSGDTLETTLYVTYNGMEADSQVVRQLITCSYDPNDKGAEPTGAGIQNYIDGNSPITYTIRFENTGNDTAFFVLITDKIDPAFDIQSFEPVASSHPVDIQLMSDRTVHFRFSDINMPWTSIAPAQSQGFVKYKITPVQGLPDFSLIENKANIYFDFNLPILTNTVFHTVADPIPLGITEINSIHNMIFPNPATTHITFTGKDKLTIDFYDLQGKLLKEMKNVYPHESYDINFLKNGIYLVRLTTGSGTPQNFKLVVHR